MALFFDESRLGKPSYEYVAWVDVMGTQSSLSRSVSAAANFIAKLHTAALSAPQRTLRLYPVMDGFYAACLDQSETLEFLRSVFVQTADEFNATPRYQHRFMIRGGLAFGPVYHGNSISASASPILNNHQPHRDSLLIGMPVIQANRAETEAPPFGLFVHESARAFAPTNQSGLPYRWWKWVQTRNEATWNTLRDELPSYLQWCKKHSMLMGYPLDRIDAHEHMATQFLA